MASETSTTDFLQTSNSLSAPGPNAQGETGTVSDDAFSQINLSVSGPVYISESVTLSYSYVTNFSPSSSGSGEAYAAYEDVLQLSGNSGPIGTGCTINPSFFAQAGSGTANCSTGQVLVSGPSDISLVNSLSVTNQVFLPGDSVTFNGTATLSQLQVYDLNGNLIQTLDLNSTMSETPEPTSLVLVAVGFLSCGFVRGIRRSVLLVG